MATLPTVKSYTETFHMPFVTTGVAIQSHKVKTVLPDIFHRVNGMSQGRKESKHSDKQLNGTGRGVVRIASRRRRPSRAENSLCTRLATRSDKQLNSHSCCTGVGIRNLHEAAVQQSSV